jgi:hypothetical protein
MNQQVRINVFLMSAVLLYKSNNLNNIRQIAVVFL